jgi:hypothetical protein
MTDSVVNVSPFHPADKKGSSLSSKNLPWQYNASAGSEHTICDPGPYYTDLMKDVEGRLEPNCPELCHDPNDRFCQCLNPAIPSPRTDSRVWTEAFAITKELAVNASSTLRDRNNKEDIQVVLLGDSITEHWLGRSMGHLNPKWQGHAQVFRQLFTTQGGGDINGVALGISGDLVRFVVVLCMCVFLLLLDYSYVNLPEQTWGTGSFP